jgi:hypothetical protein
MYIGTKVLEIPPSSIFMVGESTDKSALNVAVASSSETLAGLIVHQTIWSYTQKLRFTHFLQTQNLFQMSVCI